MPDELELVVTAPPLIEVVEPLREVVEVLSPGPQGPIGPAGPLPDFNDMLAVADVAVQDYFVLHPQSVVYDQATAVFHWVITHSLDHRPEVSVTDSAGSEYEGEVRWPDPHTVTIDFNTPLAGRAVLS